ncbi:hypothetical protein HYH03_007880 [Edaphochlamys debaryana]|uniref:Disease resistance R13L4/SHOC-2-like LRR domain-containing protein n=1 Tax=Edaphochlamys debaryana TaxID=47281 RepID=A0A835Y193_9CHLO|nr:hypothetical protein HYH03_007880 [Edaphochlamys debaryana]|eukprot:KAG2493950.1 hypothetical protein HYH03_007880 [Edaphochlamys debaryana]
MGPRAAKKRKVGQGSSAAPSDAPPSHARWAELPRELVAMIAVHTCTPVQPLPFTCLTLPSDASESCAYHRQEDRSFSNPGGQFEPLPAAAGAAAGSAAAAEPPAAELPAPDGGSGSGSGSGRGEADRGGHVPGVFRPARMSAAALAMRCVCRSWCVVLSEGVRRILLHDPAPFALWQRHFPALTHLALGVATDLLVQTDDGDGAGAGPGPSSQAAATAAAAAAAAADGGRSGRRRRPAGVASSACNGTGTGAGGGGGRVRSLASVTTLRNLQIADTALHLNLAASATFLEELVVCGAPPPGSQVHPWGRDPGSPYPVAGATYRHRGRGGAAAPAGPAAATTRRSALDQALSSLRGLRRLRLTDIDASAARLGLTIMDLSYLTSLRLHRCMLPTFLGTSRTRGGGGGGGRRAVPGVGGGGRRVVGGGGSGSAAASGGGGAGSRSGGSTFARDLILNLGSKLRDLSLQGCGLQELPPAVASGLSRLTSLDLSANWLQGLPGAITELVQLEYLDLQHNSLASLPEGLPALSRLCDLDLSANSLRALPADFGGLTALTHLHLGGLHALDLERCGPQLAGLTNLHSLGLCDVDLSPPGMGPDPPDPDSSPLAALVAALAPAGRLRELALDGCGMERLPAAFSQLTGLTALSVMENFDAADLVGGVTCLRNLAVLKLGYLDLMEPLPPGLWELTALRELDLEQNFLRTLSPEVSRLTALQVLNLTDTFEADTPLSALPWTALFALTRLRQLLLTGPSDPAAGDTVPPGISALSGLEVLTLRGAPLSPGALAEVFGRLPALSSLELCECGLRRLPPAVTRLSRLTDLQLSRNRIASLPNGFGALTRLTDLSLGCNPQLKTLPQELTRLTRLRRLEVTFPTAAKLPQPEVLRWLVAVPELSIYGATRKRLQDAAKEQGLTFPPETNFYANTDFYFANHYY